MSGWSGVSCRVNGHQARLDSTPLTSLADALRDELGLTGTKLGCRAGDCGSCTVLLDGVAVTSCLMPVAQVEGREVVSVEGLAGPDGALHPVQEAFAEANASQCGYCIPGFVVAAAALHEQGGTLTRERIVEELSGNLCRCTGYESIVSAIASACASSNDVEEEAR